MSDTIHKANYKCKVEAYIGLGQYQSVPTTVCRDGRIGVIRDHIVCDKNRNEICACETEKQAAKVAAAFNSLEYIATLKTDQLASDQQCSAVAVAMDVLSMPNN